MANSRLHNDLVNEIEGHENLEEAIVAFVNAIADRVEASQGNPVKISDLKTVLRENPEALADALIANTDVKKRQPTRSTAMDAPATTFEKPRENIRQGHPSDNEHRDQVFPETPQTDEERARLKEEDRLRAQGKTIAVVEDRAV